MDFKAQGTVNAELLPTVGSREGGHTEQEDEIPVKRYHFSPGQHAVTYSKILSKIEDLGWELLRHSPYSPDLAPSDYHLHQQPK